jgi:hypothetical protein
MPRTFRPALRPADTHHDDLLVLQVRRSALGLTMLAGDPDSPAARRAAPGLSLLVRLDRSASLGRCDHLRRRAGATGAHRTRAHHRIAEAARDAHDLDHGGALLVQVRSRQAHRALHRALLADPHVTYAALVPRRYALATRVPHTIAGIFPPPRLWHLSQIGWHDVRKRRGFDDARAVRVAVLDSGVDVNHPSLSSRITEYVHHHRDLHASPGPRDLMGHGTHVSGILAARGERGLGACGMSRCRLHVFKIFSDAPQLSPGLASFTFVVEPALLYRALADCVEQRIDVVNMSIGGPGPSDPHEAGLIQRLIAQGTTVVAAMGNLRTEGSPRQYPAALPGVVAVGATDPDDLVASFSSAGRHIALCAPGVGIWSTLPTYAGPYGYRAVVRGRTPSPGAAAMRNTRFDSWPGTSMATPLVAGAVALLRANRPRTRPGDIRARLQQTADRVPGMGRERFTNDYGAGRLNLRRLLDE